MLWRKQRFAQMHCLARLQERYSFHETLHVTFPEFNLYEAICQEAYHCIGRAAVNSMDHLLCDVLLRFYNHYLWSGKA